jgi:hypothetical protein
VLIILMIGSTDMSANSAQYSPDFMEQRKASYTFMF